MHGHDHHHNNREQNIKIAAFLNIAFTVIEVAGGLYTNSLAILSDALHDFGDSCVLVLSWIAERITKKPPDARHTYGFQRLSLFSAFFAGLVLVGGSIFILSQAIPRLMKPEQTNAAGMMGLAVAGILVNGLGALRLTRGTSQNEKVLSWHLLEDVLGWAVILAGGAIMYFWDAPIVDPIMTIGFSLFVLWGVTRNLKDTLNIFMQGVPAHISIDNIKAALMELEEVKDVHDIHVWSLEGETDIFSGHVVVDRLSLSEPHTIIQKIKGILARLHIEHSTIELENENSCSGIDCGNHHENP